ncbi:MAG: hypothetical protein M0R30_00305 [Methanoregula sp.]|uniref:hypothetical protein n=1 Tax=Methanoregula sp. TaxID=2052170 RepID=UPI0025D351D3|nr:hypothetical protein [Methanoregula sp.]MCK9630061.1 hypothetical protein [Methanoregula sp.]
MIKTRQKKPSRSGKYVAGFTLLLAVLLVIVFTAPFFEDWTWLKFFLICGLGIANLGIMYLLRTG